MITNCRPNKRRLAVFQQAMDSYDVTPDFPHEYDPDNEWPHNNLSQLTVVYTCGMICRKGKAHDW